MELWFFPCLSLGEILERNLWCWCSSSSPSTLYLPTPLSLLRSNGAPAIRWTSINPLFSIIFHCTDIVPSSPQLATFCGPCGLGLKSKKWSWVLTIKNGDRLPACILSEKWCLADVGELSSKQTGVMTNHNEDRMKMWWDGIYKPACSAAWDPRDFHMIPIIFDINIILWHLYMDAYK